MSNLAMIFPGQGSQSVGMGSDFFNHFESAQTLFKTAESILSFPLSEYCFQGPKETLTLTTHAQPALFVVSACILECIKDKGISPNIVAGHSLGEITAYYAANIIDFESACKLIKYRSEAMLKAYPSEKSGMAAVMGLSQNDLQTVIDSTSEDEVVVIANINSPSQIVISGSKNGINLVIPHLKEKGAKVIPLPVSGPFHSPLMQSASDELKEKIESIQFYEPTIPIVLNRTGQTEKNPEKLKENIPLQLLSSVHWTACFETLTKTSNQMLEVGSGKVLTNLAKKIDSTVDCTPINTIESVESLLIPSNS